MLVPIRMLLCTALASSIRYGHESCVRALLDAGADKDAKDNDGRTALMLLLMSGHESCVRALLDAGADKDAKDNDGRQLLCMLLRMGMSPVYEPC